MRGVRVCGELDAPIGQVQGLGGDVALPQAGQALLSQNELEGAEGAFVDGAVDLADAQRVGQGVDLQLEADLDDVEGSDDEARDEACDGACDNDLARRALAKQRERV